MSGRTDHSNEKSNNSGSVFINVEQTSPYAEDDSVINLARLNSPTFKFEPMIPDSQNVNVGIESDERAHNATSSTSKIRSPSDDMASNEVRVEMNMVNETALSNQISSVNQVNRGMDEGLSKTMHAGQVDEITPQLTNDQGSSVETSVHGFNVATPNTLSTLTPMNAPTGNAMLPLSPTFGVKSNGVSGDLKKNETNTEDHSTPTSKFLHSVKPAWGWDFVMTFVMPKSIADRLEEEKEPGTERMTAPTKPTASPSLLPTVQDELRPPSMLRKSTSSEDILRTLANGDKSEGVHTRKSMDQTTERIEILARLKSAGFLVSQLLVPAQSAILVRISLPENTLKRKAVLIGLKLQLKKNYGGGYLEYEPERESVFVNDDKKELWRCYFAPAERAQIVLAVLQSKEDWGCDLDVEKMLYKQTVFQVFALHSLPEREILVQRTVWAKLWDPTYKPPLRDLKDYLGARVAFYFVFVSFYARRLLAISLLSVPVYIIYRVSDSPRLSCIVLWVFSTCLVLWTTYFLETWKRRSASVSQRWGLFDFKEDTVDDTRPQFVGEIRVGFYCEGGFVSVSDLLEDSAMGDMQALNAPKVAATATVVRDNKIEEKGPQEKNISNDKDGHGKDILNEDAVKPSPNKALFALNETVHDGDAITPSPKKEISRNEVDKFSSKHAPKGQEDVLKTMNTTILRAIDLPRNAWEDPRKMRNARIVSLLVTVAFVLLMGGLTFLLLWYRTEISEWCGNFFNNKFFGNMAPGVLNAVLITLFDPIWRSVSLRLTRRENHRTAQHYENSLIYKRFVFQFLSNYISLFYIAFLRPFVDRKCVVGLVPPPASDGRNLCFQELEQQVLSLIVTRATIGQVMELVVPYMMTTWQRLMMKFNRTRIEKRDPVNHEQIINNTRIGSTVQSDGEIKGKREGSNGIMRSSTKQEPALEPKMIDVASSGNNRYAQESSLAVYNTTMEDYNELVIQFGYVCLFGVAFPPVCVVSLFNNLIEVRTDGLKILRLCQRPIADNAADIGAWYYILEVLNVLSVVTNVALLVFTVDTITILWRLNEIVPDFWYRVLLRVVVFFCAEHVLLALKAAAAAGIPDVPSKTHRTIARQQFDIARFFDIGWRDAFRGISLLKVDENQVNFCRQYAEVFDTASEDGDNRR